MNNLETALDETLNEMVLSDIPKISRIFPFKLDRKMKKFIRNYGCTDSGTSYHINTKKIIRYAIIIAIISALTFTVSAGFRFNNISLVKHDIYSNLRVEAAFKTPETIMQKYDISADMSGYLRQLCSDSVDSYILAYMKEDATIIFSQVIFRGLGGIRINTENAEQTIRYIDLNGITAMYFQEQDGGNCVIWDNGQYVFFVSSSSAIGKDELIEIAKSVKPIETE